MTEDDDAGSPNRDDRINELREADSLAPSERRELARLLVAGAREAGREGDQRTEDWYLDQLSETVESGEPDPEVRGELARALANATAVPSRNPWTVRRSTTNRVEELLDRLATVHASAETGAVTDAYARALANRVYVSCETDAFDTARACLDRLEELAADGRATVAEHRARGLAYWAAAHTVAPPQLGGPADARSLRDRESEAMYWGEQRPAPDRRAKAHADENRYKSPGDLGDTIRSGLAEVERRYERHETEGLAAAYASILRVAAAGQAALFADQRLADVLSRLRTVHEAHPTTVVGAHRLAAVTVGVEAAARADEGAVVRDRVETATALAADLDSGAVPALVGRVYGTAIEWHRYAEELDRSETTAFVDEARAGLERLRAESPVLGANDEELRAASEELLDAYVELGAYEKGRTTYEELTGADGDTAEDGFQVLTLIDAVTDPTAEFGVAADQHRPVGVPALTPAVVTAGLAAVVVGAVLLVDPSAGAFVALLGDPSLLVTAVVGIVGFVALRLTAGVARGVPPFGLFVREGPFDLVISPPVAGGGGGFTDVTTTGWLLGVAHVLLLGAVLTRSRYLYPLVFGLVCWLVLLGAAFALLLRMKAAERISPAVTTRVEHETLAELGLEPMESERLLYEAMVEKGDDSTPV